MSIKHCISANALVVVLATGAMVAQAPPASLLVPTTTHRPDEFGTRDYTVTVIQASSFTSDGPFFTDYGSLGRHFDDNGGHFFHGASIPSGAVIDFIGLEMTAPGGYGLYASLFYVDRYSGTTSGIVTVAAGGRFIPWSTVYNDTPLGWQLTQNAHNALVLDVGTIQPSQDNLYPYFGWVEIWWKRAVSPAPPTPTFGDVPTTDLGFPYIEALAASGITGGCGAGNYCPDAQLTRRQMAIFLAKALGLHWPY